MTLQEMLLTPFGFFLSACAGVLLLGLLASIMGRSWRPLLLVLGLEVSLFLLGLCLIALGVQ